MVIRMGAGSLTATIFGVFTGIGGITHSIGEIIQGNVTHDSLFFNSWAIGPIAKNLGGEPGLSVIPNVLVSGIMTLLVSIFIIVWTIFYIRRKYGGSILLFSSVLLLLFGGGIGPPTVGILAGIAGRQHRSQFSWWTRILSGGFGRILARLWPWIFAMTVANGIFLFIGSIVVACLFDVNKPELFVYSFFFAVISLLVTNLTGIAYDFQNRNITS